jgi:hypothetical protein
MDKRRKWMAVVLEEALRVGVLEPDDVIRHASPSVLATDLPPALVARVLQAGMTGGSFGAELVVQTLGPEALAEHVPLPVLWGCLQEAAELLIAEHPLTAASAAKDAVVAPGSVRTDDLPEIEVLDG